MTMTVGRLAAQGGVNIETIRYYERRGLMPVARGTPSGYRQYSAEAGLAATFEPFRPYFVGATMATLGFGFYTLRREEHAACEPGTLCASPHARRWMKHALWVATIIALPLVTRSWWSSLALR